MPSSLEQVRNLAQQNKNKGSGGQDSSAPEGAMEVGMQKTTSGLLKQAWLNLIPSWGLTLIYINIHVLAAEILRSKYFSKPGEEWMPIPGKSDAGTRLANLIEMIALGTLNLLVMLALLIILTFFIIIIAKLGQLLDIPFLGPLIKFFGPLLIGWG